jgi:hypothetical protein
MANIHEFGEIPAGGSIQPGSELIYHDDGLIEGNIIIKSDAGSISEIDGLLGGPHPNDSDVILYAMRQRYEVLNYVLSTFDCIGTENRGDTERIVVPVPSQEMIAIECHPDFLKDKMCGAPGGGGWTYDLTTRTARGKNGSLFTIDGNKKLLTFLGFGMDAPDELRGVRMYQRNSPVLRATWYSWMEPQFQCGSKIVERPLGSPTLIGIADYLRSSPVGSRVGGFGGDILWKIVQEYVGSEDGCSTIIYGDPVEE